VVGRVGNGTGDLTGRADGERRTTRRPGRSSVERQTGADGPATSFTAANGEGARTREEGASSDVGGRAPWAWSRLYRKGEGERESPGGREKRSAKASRPLMACINGGETVELTQGRTDAGVRLCVRRQGWASGGAIGSWARHGRVRDVRCMGLLGRGVVWDRLGSGGRTAGRPGRGRCGVLGLRPGGRDGVVGCAGEGASGWGSTLGAIFEADGLGQGRLA
jgi:hypothetical protein